MPGRWLHVGHPEAEDMPSGWHDEIVVHTIRRNKDGSVSVIALVNLYDDKGNVYTGEHIMNLRKRSNQP